MRIVSFSYVLVHSTKRRASRHFLVNFGIFYFSEAHCHHLFPAIYSIPFSFIYSRTGQTSDLGTEPEINKCLEHKQRGTTLGIMTWITRVIFRIVFEFLVEKMYYLYHSLDLSFYLKKIILTSLVLTSHLYRLV